jgi:hypothetical protein
VSLDACPLYIFIKTCERCRDLEMDALRKHGIWDSKGRPDV